MWKCGLNVRKKIALRLLKPINLESEFYQMPASLNIKTDQKKEHLKKLEAIRTYYELVKKGRPPEQTRKDLGLSFHDIEGFDFSIFKEAV